VWKFLRWFVLLFIILPVAIGAIKGYAAGWPASWRTADWSSSGVLPSATATPQATVMILAARTGRWKGIFAEHMSIVLKEEGAAEWSRYDVVGWGDPVRKNNYAADARWYGNVPRVIYRLEGEKAAALIPEIERAIGSYPFSRRGDYTVWPGPNSNSFVSTIVREVPGFDTELPATAIGKDWLGWAGVAPAPSKTGWTASLAGVLGVTLAFEEGLELHILGSTAGIDVNDIAIKLPALGKLSLLDPAQL
jgi:hypothetical protein